MSAIPFLDKPSVPTELIGLDDPTHPPSREGVQACGGFTWWYVDLVDESGNGVVVIWSFGLPFLPGYASSERQGSAPQARLRPSVNVVVYEAGETSFYTLHEVDADEAAWSTGEKVRIGKCSFDSRVEGGTRRLDAHIDCPVPGSDDRLTGTLCIEGPSPRFPDVPTTSAHAWTPLATGCKGTARLRVGKRVLFDGPGRAYHDRNSSPHALHRLGIRHWVWGRACFEDGERIVYALWPEQGPPEILALHVQPDGYVTSLDATVTLSQRRRAWFGVEWHGRIDVVVGGNLWMSLDVAPPQDDGPFYLRSLAKARSGALEGEAVVEVVVPDRVDLARHRPLVQMAHHRPVAPSFWLPLFSGPMADRWTRLFRWWLSNRTRGAT